MWKIKAVSEYSSFKANAFVEKVPAPLGLKRHKKIVAKVNEKLVNCS